MPARDVMLDERAAQPPLLIIGAGPAGLATAACARRQRLEFLQVDHHGTIGGAYARMDPRVRLASPAEYTTLPGAEQPRPDEDLYIYSGSYLEYLERYASRFSLEPTQATVRALEVLDDGGWRADFEGRESWQGRAVAVCTGMFDFPKWPRGLKGVEQPPRGSRELVDAQGRQLAIHSGAFRGHEPGWEHVLVIGGATSAVEIAERLVRAGARVTMSTHKGKVNVLPKDFAGRDLHDYTALLEKLPRLFFFDYCRRHPTVPGTDLGFSTYCEQGQIEVRGPLRSLEAGRAHFKDGAELEVDAVISATGFDYAMPFLPGKVERQGDHPRTQASGESRSHAGLYFVGTPCARGLSSEFLRGLSEDAPAVIEAIASRQQ